MLISKDFSKWWKRISSRDYKISPRSKKIFWGILFVIIIILILTIDLIPTRDDLEVGRVAGRDIEAPRTITFIDQEKTAELRKIAAQSASRVYEEDINVNNRIAGDIEGFFKLLKIGREPGREDGLQIDALPSKEEQQAEIQRRYPALSPETVETMLTATPANWLQLENAAVAIMNQVATQRILPGDLPRIKDQLAQEAMKLDLDKEYRLALADLLESMVRPNMILNEEATRQRQEEAMKQVEPYRRQVRQGEMILRKGDVVTADDIKALEALGLQKPRSNYLTIIGVIISFLIVVVMASIYIYKYKNEIWENQKKIVFLELMVIIVLVFAKIISFFQYSYLPYLVPVAMVSILTTVLINANTAVVLTVFLSLLVGLLFDNSFNITLTAFVGGLVGVFSVTRVSQQRNDLVRAGFNVSAVLLFLIIGLNLDRLQYNWVSFLRYIAMGMLNGIMSAILANGLLPYLESAFGFISSVRLLELSNPGQPLLKRLLVEAPGTYHHSVIVGNLAESAADNIGADSLLARVGAYYHDIGKIKRPYFFSDNQFGGENPHDKLTANLSALIINSHVKDGVELARENRIPEPIVDIIKQHHGTNLISYFYQRALNDSKHDSVEESDFRYDGPKPQSKEAAIIMLADITEAALRSKNFNRSNHKRIEGMVRELIKDKLNERQLDESELSLKDLNIIAESFVKVLTGIYHQRVDYPENVLKEIKRADQSDKN